MDPAAVQAPRVTIAAARETRRPRAAYRGQAASSPEPRTAMMLRFLFKTLVLGLLTKLLGAFFPLLRRLLLLWR